MFLKKLQHHFIFFFLTFVLLAQSLIFVVSQAVPLKFYNLKASWLEPSSGQTLVVGQNINLSAKLELKNKKIGSAYFVLADANENFVVNFETQKNSENIYSGLASWDTAQWPTGVYNLSVRASIINEQGQIVDQEESAPVWVKVVSLEEYNNLVANNTSGILFDSVVNGGGSETTGDNSSVDNALPTDNKNNTSTSTDNITPTSTTPMSAPSTTPTSTQELTSDLELLSPENNSTISNKNILVNFLTNFSSDNVTIEFINTDNAAISTRTLALEKTDGYSWVKNVELDDTFVNGSYKLLISATIPGSNLSLVKTFDYDLEAPSQIRPEDLFMNLVNLPSNVSGQVGLRAEANASIPNLDFVIEDSINHVEALRIKGANTTSSSTIGASFMAVWDTAVLPNGNYLVYVESKIEQQKVGSTKQLATVYNLKNDDQSTSTPVDFENESVHATTTATSTESIASGLTPSAEGSIDCQRSGINDPVLCQKYQAELNNSLPRICVEKNIFDGPECEKYIFANENNGCLDQKISDNIKCRDYLYKKYSIDLQCNISATSTCQQVVSEKYIARLAYLTEQKNKYLAVVNSLGADVLTLNSLQEKILAANLASTSLPLIASDKYIEVLKIKNKNVLDLSENLFVSSPAALMGDKDSDMLPDDLESYYGTDPNKADTDSDSFADGQEVLNNYNPLGAGKLDKERTALDQVILAKLFLEEPKTSALLADSNWQVSEANSGDGDMKLSGKATPNTWVNIFVYSDIPLLATTKTDVNGNWSYGITDPLTEGVHQVYIASNDKNGKLLAQSAPLTFLVANINNDLPPVGAGQQVNVTNDTTAEKSWTIYYIIGGTFLFLVLLGIILLFIKQRRQRPDNMVLEATESMDAPETPVVENKPVDIKVFNSPSAEIKLPEVLPETPPTVEINNNQEKTPTI
ncbi:MAG: hypothetical protein WCV69_02270 [Patescibacteria group bacterium]|jgi:hypothetical protein